MSEELMVVEYEGSIVYAKVNKDGLYGCPICEKAFFQSPRDLMLHITAHAKGYVERMVKVKKVE